MCGFGCGLIVRSYDFRSCPSALSLPPPTLQRLIDDCKSVFGAGGGSEKTWWVASDGKARCALEQLALAVFKVEALLLARHLLLRT
jgi:hypothetical protein